MTTTRRLRRRWSRSHKRSHSFAGAPETQALVVPANAALSRITLRISADAAPACVSPDASIELRSPDRALVASLKMPTPPSASADACPDPVKLDRVSLSPGTWTVGFTGTGSALGTIEVAPAGGL